ADQCSPPRAGTPGNRRYRHAAHGRGRAGAETPGPLPGPENVVRFGIRSPGARGPGRTDPGFGIPAKTVWTAGPAPTRTRITGGSYGGANLIQVAMAPVNRIRGGRSLFEVLVACLRPVPDNHGR